MKTILRKLARALRSPINGKQVREARRTGERKRLGL